MDHPQEGWFEHDADKVWWGISVNVQASLEKSNIRSDEIRCVGTSALGTDCLPVDKDCNPLRPAILYGIDSRAEEEIKWLTQYYGDDVKKIVRSSDLYRRYGGENFVAQKAMSRKCMKRHISF